MDASGSASKPSMTPYEATVGLYKELCKRKEDMSLDRVVYWIKCGAQLRGFDCRQGIPLLYAIIHELELPIIRLLAEHTGNILDYKCYTIQTMYNTIYNKSNTNPCTNGCDGCDKCDDNIFDKFYVEVQSAYNICLAKYYAAHSCYDYKNYLFEHMYEHGYITDAEYRFKFINSGKNTVNYERLAYVREVCEIIGLDYSSLEGGEPQFAPNLRDYRNTINMAHRNYYDKDYVFYESDVDDESCSEWSSSDESDDINAIDEQTWEQLIDDPRTLAKPYFARK